VRDSLRQVLAKETNPAKKGKLLLSICSSYATNSLFDSARLAADAGIRYSTLAGDQQTVAAFYYDKGVSYLFAGLNASALDNFLKDLKIVEKLHDTAEIANGCNSIGIVYQRMKEYDQARSWWNRGIRVIKPGTAASRDQYLNYYGNLGSLFVEQLRYDSALLYYNKALKISEAVGDKKLTAVSLQNIGDVLIHQKKYKEAMDYTRRSIALTKLSGQSYGSGGIYLNMGMIFKGIGDYLSAHEYLEEALKIEKQGESLDELRQIYDELADLNMREHDFGNAYKNHVLYTKFKDSIFNQETISTLSDLKATYEIDKRESEMEAKERVENLKRDTEERRQKLIDGALVIGFLLMGGVAFFLYRSYRIKKKANTVILDQQQEIAVKNETLKQINKEINDSIHYARYIQQAILPSAATILQSCPDSFVLFQPKDVVSGDFYFFNKLNDQEVIVAACDCTGHGVPGAFMSMIGSEQIGKIITEWKITRPADILNELHKGVRQRLRQDSTDSRDGMDVALCKLNLKAGTLEFAGANRPLWIARQGLPELIEVRPDKRPVGGMEWAGVSTFTNTEVTLQKGDRLYLFSDGYADQFGGAKNKKMMVRNFKSLLLSLLDLPMATQKERLAQEFNSWRGSHEQIDDVLIVGIQI